MLSLMNLDLMQNVIAVTLFVYTCAVAYGLFVGSGLIQLLETEHYIIASIWGVVAIIDWINLIQDAWTIGASEGLLVCTTTAIMALIGGYFTYLIMRKKAPETKSDVKKHIDTNRLKVERKKHV